jgi:glycosyltransferase EpsF
LGIEGRVKFFGVCSEMPQILAALDVFLFPSVREGLGLAFIEAQAAGVPCLGSSSLPREVDLDIGLAAFQDLDDGPSPWAVSALVMAGNPRPEWTLREKALRARGYDIQSVSKELAGIYGGTTELQTTETKSYAHQGDFRG